MNQITPCSSDDNIEETKIYADGSNDITKIIVGNTIIPHDTLSWHVLDDFYVYRWLTLREISDQLKDIYSDAVVYVWSDSPLYGKIYRYGNYIPHTWEKYGETRGYC